VFLDQGFATSQTATEGFNMLMAGASGPPLLSATVINSVQMDDTVCGSYFK
jgi:hypothetical protein